MKLVDLTTISEKKAFTIANDIDIMKGKIYLVYGDSLSGKTALCCSVIKKTLSTELKCMYIDTEGKDFSRIENIIGENPKFINKLSVNKSMDIKGFESTIKELEPFIFENDIKVVCIDSIASPYQDIQPKRRVMLMKSIMKEIRNISQKLMVTFFITTHSYTRYDTIQRGEFPVGAGAVNFYTDYKFYLRKAKKNGKIILRILNNDTEKLLEIKNGLVVI